MTELWQDLSVLELSQNEAIILAEMISSSSPLSGNEIAERVKITRYYVFEILRRLNERKFLEVIPSRPRRYRFDPYSIVYLIQQLQEEINQLKNVKNNIKSFYDFIDLTEDEKLLLKGIDQEITVKKASKLLPDVQLTKIRSIFRSLVRKGVLTSQSKTRTKIYRVTPLSELVNIEKERQLVILESKLHDLEALQAQIDGKVRSSPTSTVEKDILLLKGEKILQTVTRIVKDSNHICLARSLSGYNQRLSKTELERIIRELTNAILAPSKKGVKARLILTMDLLEDYINIISAENLKEILIRFPDLQIRVTNREFPPIDIMDTKVFIEYFSAKPGLAILVSGEEAASTKQALFENLWESSHEFRIITRGLIDKDIQKIIEKSLKEHPPHIPFPSSGTSGVNILYSNKSAFDTLQTYFLSAKKEISVAFLPDKSLFSKSIIQKLAKKWQELLQSNMHKVIFNVIIHEDVLKIINLDVLIPNNLTHEINLRKWISPWTIGFILLIDQSVLVIPTLNRPETEEWTLIVNSNPNLIKMANNLYNSIWSACEPII